MPKIQSNNNNTNSNSNSNNDIADKNDSIINYIESISNKCKNKIDKDNNNEINITNYEKGKIDDADLIIPKFNESNLLFKYNYNVNQLKTIAKHYKLKISGNKSQIISRLFSFLILSQNIIIVQKVFKGYLQRKYNNSHGPASKNRSICINDTDLYTTDNITDIPIESFFSYKDEDGFVYGFDILTIYSLIYKCNGVIKNPYNRHLISSEVIDNLKTLLKLSNILKIPICTEIKDMSLEVSCKKSLELRVLALFQNMDALGNYSDIKWFMNLNRTQLIRLLRELIDIWTYRANLSEDTKREICPPVGNPFGRLSDFSQVQHSDNLDDVRKYILEVMEKFVNMGVNRDSKCLGAYYVLGAMTLVSTEAASALPWLYQALNYQ
jgi:hypothetical protein